MSPECLFRPNVTAKRAFVVVLTALFAGLVICGSAIAGHARRWTDNKGEQVIAEFVKYENEMIVLVKDRTVLRVPYLLLSQADQEYVRKQLEAKGQADQLPPPGTPAPEIPRPTPRVNPGLQPQNGGGLIANGNAGGNVAAIDPALADPNVALGAGVPAGIPAPPIPPIGAGAGIPGAVPVNPAGGITVTTPMPTSVGASGATYVPPVPAITDPTTGYDPIASPTVATGSAPPVPAITDGSAMGPSFSGPTMVFEKQCSKCRRTVPESAKAGDRCPHCGTYWGHEENAAGGRTYATARNAGRITGLGTLIGLIVGGISWLVRKFN